MTYEYKQTDYFMNDWNPITVPQSELGNEWEMILFSPYEKHFEKAGEREAFSDMYAAIIWKREK